MTRDELKDWIICNYDFDIRTFDDTNYYKEEKVIDLVIKLLGQVKNLTIPDVSNNEVEQCAYCGSHVVPITNSDILKAVNKENEVAVCPRCGCNKITGDGGKCWCLNSECGFVEVN